MLDRGELNNAALVSYTLSMAIFHALDDSTKERLKKSVHTYLAPPPNPADGQPVDVDIWKRAHEELKALAGQ